MYKIYLFKYKSQFIKVFNVNPGNQGSLIIFFNSISGGGVQLGQLGAAATNTPIVPAPGDYDDGEIGGMIGKGNRSTRRKPAPVPLCSPQILHDLTGGKPVPLRWKARD
jgi:hypothetical protein